MGKKKNISKAQILKSVQLRDKTILTMGDEVQTSFHKSCLGKTFIICEMNDFPGGCESGIMLVVHLKGDPERKITGLKKEGYDWVEGIDANWFKKL